MCTYTFDGPRCYVQRPCISVPGTTGARRHTVQCGKTLPSSAHPILTPNLVLGRPLQHAVSAPATVEAPSGPPPLIGCSQCRKPMHLDCFVAHYNVVPARRDYTYCPAHVYVPKAKPPGGGERKAATGGGGHGAHKRERSEREGERKKRRRVERVPSPGPCSVTLTSHPKPSPN